MFFCFFYDYTWAQERELKLDMLFLTDKTSYNLETHFDITVSFQVYESNPHYKDKMVKSEVWPICHCLGLGHETMVWAVCLFIFLCQSLKPKGRQDDSPDIHWRRWRQASTSPVNIKAVTLTTFPYLWWDCIIFIIGILILVGCHLILKQA